MVCNLFTLRHNNLYGKIATHNTTKIISYDNYKNRDVYIYTMEHCIFYLNH